MALKDEFEKTGNWLFRRRSYLPLILIFFFLLSLPHFKYFSDNHKLDLLWEVLCLAVSFFGLTIRIFTIAHTPRGTSGRVTKKQKAEVLNITGIYSIVRHPLYLGNFFIWLGISMFFHLWWLSIIFILIFWLYYERIMFAEECFLRKKFGIKFEKWADKTPAFLPRFKNWKKPALCFSIRKVLKKEYSGFFGIIACFTFLEVIGDYFITKKLEFDLFWIIIFSVGLLIYLILRTLKKKTNLLSEEGR